MCVGICMFVSVYMYVYVCLFINSMFVCAYVCMCACMCMYLLVCVCLLNACIMIVDWKYNSHTLFNNGFWIAFTVSIQCAHIV